MVTCDTFESEQPSLIFNNDLNVSNQGTLKIESSLLLQLFQKIKINTSLTSIAISVSLE